MSKDKLVVIGNSVTIRVRPEDSSLNYANLVANKLKFELIHLGEGALLLEEFSKQQKHQKIPKNSHVIINFGIVDACTRPIPKSLYNFMMETDKSSFKQTRRLIRFMENKFRTKLVKLKGKKSWTDRDKFIQQMNNLIDIIKSKNCSYSILGINYPNNRIESVLPGSQENVILFNKELEKLNNYISVHDLNDQEYYPDGIHYNSKGHQLITDKIINHYVLTNSN